MEITDSYTERHNKALDLYRHEQDMLCREFCEAYTAWATLHDETEWYFLAREQLWQKYLKAREAWTGY